jgi:hypothetical protein
VYVLSGRHIVILCFHFFLSSSRCYSAENDARSLLDFSLLSVNRQRIGIKILFAMHTHTQTTHSIRKKTNETNRNQIISKKMFVKKMVNIEDDESDNEERNPSFDRRCILFVFASEVERRASNGLRVFSTNKEREMNTSVMRS